ncbi:helix-turn-helix transcriptional regulator [Dinoroseobacter sp. PD6]|uniref:helix-turn-helix transcriptional regulator n=1 Tax=Dinoroseobacter sp. PD6 TaxID=3028384 RepID=UPI00237C1701|nr:helix-turn-helix transcriptional regulator [Dinoroseobacter sp. PD6]MDD9718369.1 helix-turn-helix transcriptional regulator [Dinoroseobacter sp. PD6]
MDLNAPDAPRFLTTKEVADLLRVRERKVYDLAGADEIPHRRITGKLLFPREELLDWIEGDRQATALPPVLTGSHDPWLAWAVGASDCGLAVLQNGSAEGLARFAAREAAFCGLHIPEDDGWNVGSVRAQGVRDCVLIGWAIRQRGLLLSPALAADVKDVADLRGQRVVLRQPGAGAAVLLERLLDDAGMALSDLVTGTDVARTEHEAAAAVASGEADAALGLAAMARQFKLGFVPIVEERFDLLVDRAFYFSDPFQRLLQFASTPAALEKARALGGYDVSELGTVRWNGP